MAARAGPGRAEAGQLSLEGMPDRLVRVTPARLATWDDCPRRYRLTYLDQPPSPRGGAWAHSTLGAVVHRALQGLFVLPVARRTPARAAALVDTHWSDEGFRDDAQAAGYRARARTWVADYAAAEATDDPDRGPRPLGVERWVSAATGSLVAEGRVDRVDDRDGDAVVVDYKTGRRVPTTDDAASSPALALYAIAAAGTLRRRCRRVELHHLPSATVAVAEHDDASLRAHRERAEASATRMDAARAALASAAADDPARIDLFPAVPAPRCGWCPVRRGCPEGRAAAPEPPAWSLLAP